MINSDYRLKKTKYEFVKSRLIELGFTKITRDGKIESFFLPDLDLGFGFGVSFRLYRKWSCDRFEFGFIFSELPVKKFGTLCYYDLFLLAINITLGLHKDPAYFNDITKRQESEFDWEFWLDKCIHEVRQLKTNLPLVFEEDQVFGYPVTQWLLRPINISFSQTTNSD